MPKNTLRHCQGKGCGVPLPYRGHRETDLCPSCLGKTKVPLMVAARKKMIKHNVVLLTR